MLPYKNNKITHHSLLFNTEQQWTHYVTGWWFYPGTPGTPVSPTNKTDRHDITDILLKVALNTIILTLINTTSFTSYFWIHSKKKPHENNYRDVPKVFGHCNFLLYISYKTTIFESIIPKSILVRFWWNFYQQKRERT